MDVGGTLVLVLVVVAVAVVVAIVYTLVRGGKDVTKAVEDGDPALQPTDEDRRGFFG
jgi:hypothetical protein